MQEVKAPRANTKYKIQHLQHGHAETREPRERNPQDRANRPAEQAEADHDRKTREPKERTHRTGDRQTEPEGADQDKLE